MKTTQGCGCLGAMIGAVLALVTLAICLIAGTTIGVTAGWTILAFVLPTAISFFIGLGIDIFS